MLRELGRTVRQGHCFSTLQPARRFSAAAPIVSFRTPESNPANHNASHIGRFYTIPPETYKTLFETVTRALPSGFSDQCKTFRECCLLVRSPFIDLKNCIEAYDSSLPTLRYVLYGKLGAGKSTTLCHLLHYGYSRDFILVNVPYVPLWTRFIKEIVPSPTRPGFFDHTTDSVIWLSHFRNQNTGVLAKLDLKTVVDHEWSKRETTPAGSTLLEIIDHGIARPAHAVECIFALVTELKQLSTEGKCKTMVLIDGVNGLYYDFPRMRDENLKGIPHTKLALFQAFKEFFKHDWSGGVVACTVDKYGLNKEDRATDFPRQLLTKQGWEDFDPFVPISIEMYSSQEVQTTIDYFLERKWLAHPEAGSVKARKELETLSVRNPYTLRQLCNSR